MKFLWYLIALISGILSCGAPQVEKHEYEKPPQNSSPPQVIVPQTGKPSFAEEQQIMQKYCVECHASSAFTKSEQALIGSTAKQRVQNATMPPNYATQLAAADKARFISFF